MYPYNESHTEVTLYSDAVGGGTDPGTTYYTVSVSASPSAGGTVSGGGSIANGSGCTVTASANSNYTFTNWTESGTVVSSSASYSFTVSGDRSLVANFTDTGGSGGDDDDSDNSGGTTPDKPTIEVSEVTVPVLKGLEKYVTAKANVENAFSRSVEVKLTDDKSATDAFVSLLGSDNGRIIAFDISLYAKGTNQKVQPKDGYAVTISIPLPNDLWDVREDIQIGYIVDGEVVVLPSKLVWQNEMWNIVFETDHFSPYALLVGVDVPQSNDNANHNPETGGYPDDASVEVPQTGDPGVHPLWWLWVMIPAFVLAVSLGVVVWRRRRAEG